MAKKIRLFGYPVRKSLSPAVQNGLWRLRGLDFEYILLESTNIDEALAELYTEEVAGLAVTMPHKVVFMEHVDKVSNEAAIIGSINTVYKREIEGSKKPMTIGTNTDWVGVREALVEYAPSLMKKSPGRKGMVIGAGGAARAAIYALWESFQMDEIYLVNRIQEEMDQVVQHFAPIVKIQPVTSIEQAQELETPLIVVSTIPDIEPKSQTEKDVFAISTQFLTANTPGYLLEMCYLPTTNTRMARIAEARNWQVVPGTEVMIHQGIAQQNYWAELDEKPTPQVVDKARSIVYEKMKTSNL